MHAVIGRVKLKPDRADEALCALLIAKHEVASLQVRVWVDVLDAGVVWVRCCSH